MSGRTLALLAVIALTASLAGWIQGARTLRLSGKRSGFVAGFALASGLGVAALVADASWVGGIGAGIAVLGGGAFLLLAALSGQEPREPAVKPGDPMLAFTAPDASGAPFDSASLAGRPYLLKFFRGHW